MKENKTVRVSVRLTPEQFDSIRARAETAGLETSTYIRAAAMRHKITVVPGLNEMTHELKMIGRNINQLAVLAHKGKVQIASFDETVEKLGLLFAAVRSLAEQESS
jgi:hypothetical protein